MTPMAMTDPFTADLTPIQQFFYKGSIFVTGGTGFLGKVLLNKILTSCPGIENIFLLVRSKRGKDVQTRIDDIFEDPIFKQMKEVCPKYRYLVQGMTGDCLMPGLGLSDQDKETLINKCNIVFHMAATVRFDEKLKISMQINVKACKDMLNLCHQMRNLKSVVHVSTAYTQCPLPVVEEKFYKPPIDSRKIIALTDCLNEKFLDNITPMLLEKWPNTYTFTKAIAEDVIRQNSAGLPIGMVRPGIVISTYQEPVRGWIDNFYGPTGVIAGAGTGVLRTLRCNPKNVANMVPVDMCVNGILCAAWDVAEKYSRDIQSEVPIYNYCSPKENELTWGDFTDKTTKYGIMHPPLKAIWYLCYTNNPSGLMHFLSMIFLHYLPAVFIDIISMCMGKKPRMLRTYKKIHKFMKVIEYFSMREWDFHTFNFFNLWAKLDPKDQKLFFFDMRSMNWDQFLEHYFVGIRQYLLNDPLETVPEALKKWNRLYWLHNAIKVALVAVIVRYIFMPVVGLLLF